MWWYIIKRAAGMAELADAHGSGPCGSNTMRVQVPFPAYLFMVFKESDGSTGFVAFLLCFDAACVYKCIQVFRQQKN